MQFKMTSTVNSFCTRVAALGERLVQLGEMVTRTMQVGKVGTFVKTKKGVANGGVDHHQLVWTTIEKMIVRNETKDEEGKDRSKEMISVATPNHKTVAVVVVV